MSEKLGADGLPIEQGQEMYVCASPEELGSVFIACDLSGEKCLVREIGRHVRVGIGSIDWYLLPSMLTHDAMTKGGGR